MRDYIELVKALMCCVDGSCEGCPRLQTPEGEFDCKNKLKTDAADAIEELVRIGSKMHTWIFLHTTDEQAAYDEIGLTKEQNAMFGYSGQMILKADPPKEDANENHS